jgi:hypothetical protein
MRSIFLLLFIIVSSNSIAQIVINEFSAHKGIFDENDQETDWIEIYNSSNQEINLSSYFLTDELANLEKWQLPNVNLMPNSIITFYSSGKDTQFNDGVNDYYHTNFKLSPSETIALYDGNEIIDSTYINSDLYFGISMGKSPDGSNQWCYFNNVTPNDFNGQSLCYQGITEEAIIDLESGWYSEPQSISISDSDQDNFYVFYTTDGSIPTIYDTPYTQPININSNTSFSFRSFSYGYLPSKLNDRTFIFEEDNHELAVFSIHTDPENLWNEQSGIYVSGPNPSPDYPYYDSNFWQPWSKFSRIEYFDGNKTKKAEESLDLEIHGGWSRAEPQKSFRLDFKSKYTGRLEEAVIPAKNHIESYNNFNLRNGGQHTWSDKIQDAIISRIASETNVNYMAYEPCITYLNGEYWGVYGIREKIDEHYIEDNYGFNSDSIDLMNAWSVLAGSDENAIDSYQIIMDENANSNGFYELFSSIWNVDNYMDYFIIQTFIQNMDWLGIAWGANNIKLWRPQSDDGKWNYVLYDTDGSLGYFGQSYYDNYLAYAMNPAYVNQHSQIFNKVLQNEEFRCQFTNRYADLINTSLSLESAQDKTEIIKNDMQDAMPRHIERWQNSGNLNGTISSIPAWENSINNILEYYGERVSTAQSFLDYTLYLEGMNDISLDVFPTNSGSINLNTISVDSFPWNGIYFNNCEISITAIADSGYSFTHWSDLADNIISEDNNLFVSVEDYQEFKAHFVKCENLIDATIYTDENSIYANIISSTNQISYQWYQNGIPYSTDSVLTKPSNGNYQLEINSDNCSLLTNEIYFYSTVDLNNPRADIMISLYPNPFKNQAILDLSKTNYKTLQINIIDSRGRIVRKYNDLTQKKLIIQRGDLKNGVYILEIQSQNLKSRSKVVIN